MLQEKEQLPEELRAIVEEALIDKFGDAYTTNIIKVEMEPELTVTFKMSYYSVSEWEVEILECKEFEIGYEYPDDYEINIYTEHPLLDEHNKDQYYLYIGRKATDVFSLISDMYVLHHELFNDDVPADNYFIGGLYEACKMSHGVFAKGPQHVLLRYKEVLDKHTTGNSMLLEKKSFDSYKLLEVGGGMFIAKDFRFRKIS